MTDIKPNKLKIFLTQIYGYVQARDRSWSWGVCLVVFGIFAYFCALQKTSPAPVESTNRQQVFGWPKRENRLVAPTDWLTVWPKPYLGSLFIWIDLICRRLVAVSSYQSHSAVQFNNSQFIGWQIIRPDFWLFVWTIAASGSNRFRKYPVIDQLFLALAEGGLPPTTEAYTGKSYINASMGFQNQSQNSSGKSSFWFNDKRVMHSFCLCIQTH